MLVNGRVSGSPGKNVSITSIGAGPNVDSGGRLRVSENKTLKSGTHHYGIDPDLFRTLEINTGAITYDANANEAILTAASSGDRAVLQSAQYIRYQPGKGQLIKGTANFKSTGTGIFSVVQRSNTSGTVIDTRINQADFNADSIDGNGNSGVNIDFDKAGYFYIQFLHLGVAPVVFGMMSHEGILLECHKFKNPSQNVNMWAAFATLPFRVEIINIGTNIIKRMGYFDDTNGIFWEMVESDLSKNTFNHLCYAVESEGGSDVDDEAGIPTSASTGSTVVAVGATLIPLLSIRPKQTFQGKDFRGSLIPTNATVTSSRRDLYCVVLKNATLTGPSWTSRGADSIMEYDVSSTAISGGQVIAEFHVIEDSSFGLTKTTTQSQIELVNDILNTNSDTLTIAAQNTAGAANALAVMGAKELRG